MLSAKNIPLASAVANLWGSASGGASPNPDQDPTLSDPEERKKRMVQAGMVDGLPNVPGSPVISNAVLGILGGR